MEKRPPTREERMMAIFLESSSKYSLSFSLASSTSSSSSSSSDSLEELSSSGSSMLSSLGLSILYWEDIVLWNYAILLFFCPKHTFSLSFWRIASRSSSCFLKNYTFIICNLANISATCIFLYFYNLWHCQYLCHLYFSFLSSFVSPASLLLSSSPENPVNVFKYEA